MDFVGQLANLHRSGAGSIHHSIRYEHALSLSSRRCHLQISAKETKNTCFPSLKLYNEVSETKVMQEVRFVSFRDVKMASLDPRDLVICTYGIIRVLSAEIVLPRTTWDPHSLPTVKCLN